MRAVREAGYEPGTDVKIAIDAAASELYNEETGRYDFPGESSMTGIPVSRSAEEMVEYFRTCPTLSHMLHRRRPPRRGLGGWQLLTRTLGHRIQLVGDDLFVTNEARLLKGIRSGAGNAILVKVNQIGP